MTHATDTANEIVKIRLYKAPRELLLRMWSNPEHLTRWWGPVGFTTTTHELEFRAGGLWRFTMHGPDGREYPNVVRYTIVSSDRIEYSHGGGGDLVDFAVKVSFAERGDETKMTFRMIFPSHDEMTRAEKEYNAEDSLAMTMDRLSVYTSTQQLEDRELVIVRKFRASKELVWRALTEEDQVKQWMCPLGLTMERSGGDFRPGGQWSARMVTPNGASLDVEGEYLEIEPMTSLKFSHKWKREDGTYKPTTTITMTLSEQGGETTLVFVQSGFWSEEARAAHLGGWSTSIFQLDVLLGSSKADKTVSLTREFKAPIELVWKCFTEPARLAEWFAPKPYTIPVCEIELRPGGALYLVMRSPEGAEHPMYAEITDVEPNQSFGWVNCVPDFDGETAFHGGTFVIFDDLDGMTRVTVHSYASAATEMGAMMVGGMDMGWNMSLDRLGEVVAAS